MNIGEHEFSGNLRHIVYMIIWKSSGYNIESDIYWSVLMSFSIKTRILHSLHLDPSHRCVCFFYLLPLSRPIKPKISKISQPPAFDPADCMFKLPAGIKNGDGVQCGYLTVPEDRSKPAGPTIKLAVAIIKRSASRSKSGPAGYGTRWTWRLNHRNLR